MKRFLDNGAFLFVCRFVPPPPRARRPIVRSCWQDDFVRALVDGESLCKELAEAGEDEEAANAGMEKARKITWGVYVRG